MTTDTVPALPSLSIHDSFYIAALEAELARVNRERLLLRAALDQQAAAVNQLVAEHERLTAEVERLTTEVAELVAERDLRSEVTTDRYPGVLLGGGQEVNGAVPAHSGP